MLIKITANANTLTLLHVVVSANGFAYIPLGGNNSVETSAAGKITAVCLYANNTVNRVLVGSTAGKVSRVQLGEMTTKGGFSTYLDSI